MKKLLLTLAAGLLLAGNAWADEVNLTASALTATSDAAVSTWSPNEFFTFTFNKQNGSTNPTYNTKGKDIRLYAKATAELKAADGVTVDKVVFNISTQGKKRLAPITSSEGTIATQATGDATVTWTGSANTVTFTVGEKADFGSDGSTKAGQLCFSSVTITYTLAAGGKEAANLSFPEESYTAYLGEPFVAPTLTKDTDAAVSYISTVESVATVSADGAVEIVGLGTTVIKATTPANDTYYAGSAQYTLTVLDPNTLYSNACTSSDCGFTQVATTGTPWQIDTAYGLKASGFINRQNTATDAIMASPVIDLNARQNVELDFEQAVNQFKANGATLTGADMAQINNYISVVICTNPNARAAEEWIKLADVQLPETQGWTFYANPTIKIDNKYAGRYVKIGFRYVSTADMAGTWEIKNVTVKAQRETSAVENIAVSDEDALVEYYNLQGVRVAEPANGIFIRRQGNSVSKVYIR